MDVGPSWVGGRGERHRAILVGHVNDTQCRFVGGKANLAPLVTLVGPAIHHALAVVGPSRPEESLGIGVTTGEGWDSPDREYRPCATRRHTSCHRRWRLPDRRIPIPDRG